MEEPLRGSQERANMLEEVISLTGTRHGNTVASLQAWLEDAEKMLNQSEHAKKVKTAT